MLYVGSDDATSRIYSITCAPLAPGSSCAFTDTCTSGACRGGVCCSAAAASSGCLSCATSSGACALSSPGEACSSSFDCGTNACLGGCCCSSSAVQTAGCTSCRCWSNASTTAATAGSCVLSPPPATVTCNASVTTTANVSISSQLVTFPAAFNLSATTPLLVLSAASPLNALGVDIVIATPAACAAWAAAPSPLVCDKTRSYAIAGSLYYYAGTAAALNMQASGTCAF